jgi:hypothetical protein
MSKLCPKCGIEEVDHCRQIAELRQLFEIEAEKYAKARGVVARLSGKCGGLSRANREYRKRLGVESTEKSTIKSFTMDGSEHESYEETGCCSGFGKRCTCGGWMHYQPVYGGYYYECEVCHENDV